MKRNLGLLDGQSFDVVILGGGIYGACLAWDAVSRGLSTALIEKSDFASATSANSLKIIHGGLRYLQHLDIKRFRESTMERTTLMNIAPHLIHPLPVLIPTYGHGARGREVMFAALVVNHVLGYDCKQTWDPDRRIPWGEIFTRAKVQERLPFLSTKGLSGGALFYDAQVYNSERLVLSFLHSAAEHGAVLCNYVEGKGFIKKSGSVVGVQVQDRISGQRFDVLGKMVVNTAGPWNGEIVQKLQPGSSLTKPYYAKAVNLVMTSIDKSLAFGVPVPWDYRDDRVVVHRGERMLFVSPWRGYSLVGTIYSPHSGAADDCMVTQRDIDELLGMVQQGCPSLGLSHCDVRFVHGGLLPCANPARTAEEIQLTAKCVIHDHRTEGVDGIVSVTGVKYTTARLVAQKVVDHIVTRLQRMKPHSRTASTPLFGGDIDQFEPYLRRETLTQAGRVNASELQPLIRNYGTAYTKVLDCVSSKERMSGWNTYGALDLLKSQIRFAVREEMAIKLADFVFRRSEVGSAGLPEDETLRICAEEMGQELGWDPNTIKGEFENTRRRFVVAA